MGKDRAAHFAKVRLDIEAIDEVLGRMSDAQGMADRVKDRIKNPPKWEATEADIEEAIRKFLPDNK